MVTLPRDFFTCFFLLKYSQRVVLGTRVLFKASIYHFKPDFDSRKIIEQKFKNFPIPLDQPSSFILVRIYMRKKLRKKFLGYVLNRYTFGGL